MSDPGRALPAWLAAPAPLPTFPPAGAPRRDVLADTVHAIAAAFERDLVCEAVARRPGLLQGVDPRVKLGTLFALIGIVGALHHVGPLLILNGWLLWLAHRSQLPLGAFAKRVWGAVLLFTGTVVFPTLFNIIRPGTPLLVLFHTSHPITWGPWTLPSDVAITHEGVAGASLLLLRVGASVSLTILLTLTTPWPRLLQACRTFRVPPVFCAVLEMTYRYLFLLLRTSSDLFLARRSRLVGQVSGRTQRRFVAGAMASLWGKTAALSEEVHNAMVARGYAGIPRVVGQRAMAPSDWVWVALVGLVALLVVGGDRVLG